MRKNIKDGTKELAELKDTKENPGKVRKAEGENHRVTDMYDVFWLKQLRKKDSLIWVSKISGQ